MEFGLIQQRYFECNTGSYSAVTKRENYDSQITLTDIEADIAINFFGIDNIPIGNVNQNSEKAKKVFYLYPTGQEITLNLVFPKPHKPELRLYLSIKAGFKPAPFDIWFLYPKNNQLFIGAMKEKEWRSLEREDEEDFIYNDIIYEDAAKINWTKHKERFTLKRNTKLALNRFQLAGYKCENDPDHSLFIARATNMPYLEAHHLVPVKLQNYFSEPLDCPENIFALCPYCHRAVHHAKESTTSEIIFELLRKRNNVIKRFDISDNDISRFYNCESIE